MCTVNLLTLRYHNVFIVCTNVYIQTIISKASVILSTLYLITGSSLDRGTDGQMWYKGEICQCHNWRTGVMTRDIKISFQEKDRTDRQAKFQYVEIVCTNRHVWWLGTGKCLDWWQVRMTGDMYTDWQEYVWTDRQMGCQEDWQEISFTEGQLWWQWKDVWQKDWQENILTDWQLGYA